MHVMWMAFTRAVSLEHGDSEAFLLWSVNREKDTPHAHVFCTPAVTS